MAMVRPGGRILKIAENVVPGLKKSLERKCPPKSKEVPNDPVEMKIVDINEARGRFSNARRAKSRRI